ncbi:MAG: methyltransferase domain-containing protein [Polyangiaceae bacterium]|nr:methyltransferase domain-containing protein [Polyangiaceae bacterium]MCW5791597.1 methyltransferase domain-containing protein [Polyangiaceae bacterium]
MARATSQPMSALDESARKQSAPSVAQTGIQADESPEAAAHGARLHYAIPEAAYPPGLSLLTLSQDDETRAYLRDVVTSRPGWLRTAARGALSALVSDFDANGLLGMYPMHLVSEAQLRALLSLPEPTRLTRALDVGAGAGDVTERIRAVASEVVTTERSFAMARRLRRRGYACHRVDLADDLEGPSTSQLTARPFELICLFNVIDRCPRPRSLLTNLRSLLTPARGAHGAGGRLLLSVPLPFDPMYYQGAAPRHPLEALGVTGDTWAEAARDLTGRVLPALGFTPRVLSRAPYLSGGDSRRPLYVLDAALVVCEPA